MHGEYSYFARGATRFVDPDTRDPRHRAALERLSFAAQLAPLAHADAKAPLEAACAERTHDAFKPRQRSISADATIAPAASKVTSSLAVSAGTSASAEKDDGATPASAGRAPIEPPGARLHLPSAGAACLASWRATRRLRSSSARRWRSSRRLQSSRQRGKPTMHAAAESARRAHRRGAHGRRAAAGAPR